MNRVSFISAKGGSCKTTSVASLSVAAALHEQARVLVLDTDTMQKSLTRWGEIRKAPWPVVEACGSADVHRRLIRARQERYDLVLVDTPGYDGAGVTLVMNNSDFVVIPCRPTSLDCDAVLPSLRACRRLGKRFGILMTSVKANTAARVEATRARHRCEGGYVLDAQLTDRVRYQTAMATGLSVVEMSGDTALSDEPFNIWRAIRAELERPLTATKEEAPW